MIYWSYTLAQPDYSIHYSNHWAAIYMNTAMLVVVMKLGDIQCIWNAVYIHTLYMFYIAIIVIYNMLINDGLTLMCVYRRDSTSLLLNAMPFLANIKVYTHIESKQSYLFIHFFLLFWMLLMTSTIFICHATMTHAVFFKIGRLGKYEHSITRNQTPT